MKEPRVAIAGATGMVGQEFIRILEQRDFPVGELRLLASERSRGRSFEFRGETIEIEVLSEKSFEGIDIALFSAGSGISRKFAPVAAASGAVVIDNSSAWRMEPEVPLVVPEVNPGDTFKHKGIIANPNCSTIQMVVVLDPLHREYGLERVVVTTFQSVSGTGKNAVEELASQVSALECDEAVTAEIYPHQIAFNCLPHIDVFKDNGYTAEEMKMVEETRKIMGLPGLRVTATCVRVPVYVCHSESVNCQFRKPVEPGDAREVLARAQGVEVVDDPSRDLYPLAIDCAGKDPSYVGRIRKDYSAANSINMWIVSDNLRKGAALNAVQIAELLLD